MDIPQLDSTSSTTSLVESPVPIDQYRIILGNNLQYFSCNGILLITYPNNIIVLWNPATKESRRIPCPIRSKSGGLYNFCYFPRIDSYKIFRLGPKVFNGDLYGMDVDIFSTKDNSWKSVGMFPSNYDFLDSTDVVMPDGIVYMIAKRIGNLVNREKLSLVSSFGDNHEDGSMMFQKFNSSGFVFDAYKSTTHKFEQVNVTEIEGLNLFNRVVPYVETLSSPNS
ncbi:hypothetical protein H5410_060024 [Solanum commersonii]|uniref:F-box associated beta-propeller type 1 domain-containing protein n=1 Tax=Solanum commersonii TaxID=4109 RepID=A0A9J5W430_SOLCO|nr:hypothetical protein H5410_060024 [Solanum commersonii]